MLVRRALRELGRAAYVQRALHERFMVSPRPWEDDFLLWENEGARWSVVPAEVETGIVRRGWYRCGPVVAETAQRREPVPGRRRSRLLLFSRRTAVRSAEDAPTREGL